MRLQLDRHGNEIVGLATGMHAGKTHWLLRMACTALQAAVHFQTGIWLGCVKARTRKVPSA